MANPFDHLLPPARPASAVTAADADAAWVWVREWGDGLSAGSRMVACRWASVPPVHGLILDVGGALAGVALADWPLWYETNLAAAGGAGNTFERNVGLREKLRAVCRGHVRVNRTWLRRSAERCLHGQPPFDRDDNAELQLAQLALAVCPGRLVFVLAAGPDAPAAGAGPMAAAAEWLHRVTGAPAVVVAPPAWRGAAGLERLWVAPDVERFGPDPAADGPPGEGGVVEAVVPAASPAGTTAAINSQPPAEPAVGVTPLPGRPHPNSDAEKLLFALIQADSELAPLLAFNQSVPVGLGQSYRVDLLSATCRVVVEIDGREHRGSAYRFFADCERDYQLMMRGYVVLRLPNELVYGNTDVAVARIRDLLRHRAGQSAGG